MSKLGDIFGKSSSEPEGIQVDLTMTCSECGKEADACYYVKQQKTVTTVCPSGHTLTENMDLSWLVR